MIDTEKNKTAWHNQKMPESMMDAHFPHIVNSDHFKAIKQCFGHISEAKSLIDLGCGKAELSDAFPEYKYCGADLPHIIQKVSKISKPSLEYVEFDATICNMDFVSSFDVIVMNSFLSEIEKADEILCKVLKYAPKYVVIHRQEIGGKEDREEYLTYGGLKTTKYTFGKDRLEEILKEYSFTKLFETECMGRMKSLTLKTDGI
jgi:hypothetical protein